MLESAEDLGYIMRWDKGQGPSAVHYKTSNHKLFANLDAVETQLVECLQVEKSLNLDELLQLSSFTINQLSTLLLQLELKGVVRVLPANRYQLCL